MKKWMWVLLLALMTAVVLSFPVRAQAPDPEEVADALPPRAAEMMEGTALSPDGEKTLGNLMNRLTEAAWEYGRQALTAAGAMVAAAVFCTLASAAFDMGKKAADSVLMAGALAVTMLGAGNVRSFLQEASQVIGELALFSKTLLPVMASCAAASGKGAVGAAGYTVTAFFMDMLITAANHGAVPLVYGFTALSFGAAALDNGGLRAAAKLMHTVVIGLLTVLMLTFTIFLTTAGAITGAAGATATKLTKTVISTVLPVVGGIVSDAASAVVNGAVMLKNAVGVYGLLGVCAVCAVPVVKLAIHTLLYRMAGALAGAVADARLAGLIGAIGEAVGMMLGITGACAMMLFLSVTCLIRVGTGG